jgi:hypothetical protein
MKGNDGWKFAIPVTIKFSVAWLALVIILGVGVVWCYSRAADRDRPTIIFAVSILGGVLTIWGLLQATENLRRSNQEKKLTASASFVQRWNNPAYLELKRRWRLLNPVMDDLGEEAAAERLEQNIEERIVAVEILNFFEEIAISIETNTADEQLLKLYFHTIFLKSYERYGFWMKTHREKRHAPRYWNVCLPLMKKWKDEEK